MGGECNVGASGLGSGADHYRVSHAGVPRDVGDRLFYNFAPWKDAGVRPAGTAAGG